MTTPARVGFRLDTAVFLAGASLMGLEIVGSRVLAPVFGTSLFVWGALITTFLTALAIGYALGGRLADRRPDPALLANLLAVAGVILLVAFAAPDALLATLGAVPVPDRFRALVASAVLFGPPSVLMGMVTPFAVRLAAREIATIGTASGRLSALSTAGSILGSFATAFLLIPAFPTRSILFGLGAALLAASLLVPAVRPARRLVLTLLAVFAGTAVFFGAPAFAPPPLPIGTVVFQKETAYHRLRVVDQGLRRALYFDNRVQGYAPARPDVVLARTYADGMALALLFPSRLRSVVVIGLGAGMVPSLLSARAPEIAVTSIELDPEVVQVARRYFSFAPPPGSRVLVGDGRRVLDQDVPEADVIIVDAYFSDSLPFHLITEEFDALCARKLPPDGAVAVNFGGDLTGARNQLFWAAVRTMARVFPRVYIFCPEFAMGRPTFHGNAIVVATRSPERLDRGTITDRAAALAIRLGRPAIRAWATDLYDGEIRTADVPVLTDAFAPTDALQHLGR